MIDLLPAVSPFVLLALGPLLLPALGVIYLGLRLRELRGGPADPEVGLKAVYHFFLSLGVLLALTGLSVVAFDMTEGVYETRPQPGGSGLPPMTTRSAPQTSAGPATRPAFPSPTTRPAGTGLSGTRGEPTPAFREGPILDPSVADAEPEFFDVNKRNGVGLALAGAMCAVFFLLLIQAGTNDRKFPAARRAFVGLRLAISGVVVLALLTAFMIAVLQKDPGMRVFEVLTAFGVVWVPSLVVHMVLLRVSSGAGLATSSPAATEPRPSA